MTQALVPIMKSKRTPWIRNSEAGSGWPYPILMHEPWIRNSEAHPLTVSDSDFLITKENANTRAKTTMGYSPRTLFRRAHLMSLIRHTRLLPRCALCFCSWWLGRGTQNSNTSLMITWSSSQYFFRWVTSLWKMQNKCLKEAGLFGKKVFGSDSDGVTSWVLAVAWASS